MNAATIAKAKAAAGIAGAWTLRRARERSTWLGLAALAAALGHAALSEQLGKIGDAVMTLGGAGLVVAPTSTPPAQP